MPVSPGASGMQPRFLIDRFGRVWRVVRETDAANHAGWSVWADEHWVYLNLNDSFLAVAFEASSGAPAPVNPAQVRAGRALVEEHTSELQSPTNLVCRLL